MEEVCTDFHGGDHAIVSALEHAEIQHTLLFLWVSFQVLFLYGKFLLTAQIGIQHLVVINLPKAGAKGADFQCLYSLDFGLLGSLGKWEGEIYPSLLTNGTLLSLRC